jgi:hypothetical protein
VRVDHGGIRGRPKHLGRRKKGAKPPRLVPVRKHYRLLGATKQQEQFSGFDNPIQIQHTENIEAAFHRWVLGHLEGGENPGRFTSTNSRFKTAFRNLATAGLVTLGPESDWRMAPFGDWNTPMIKYQTAYLTPNGAQLLQDDPRDPIELYNDWHGGSSEYEETQGA